MRAAVGMLAVVALAAFGACGGDGASVNGIPTGTAVSGGRLSSEEYFQRFEALLDDYTRRQRATSQELTESSGAATDLEERKQSLVGFLEASAANAQGYLQELGKVLPPLDAQGLHDEFLELFTQGAGVFQSYIDRVAGVESQEEFDEVVAEFGRELGPAGEKVDEACLALQAFADESGIQLKLACGGGEPG